MRVPMSEDEITRMNAKFYLWELKTKRLFQKHITKHIIFEDSYTGKPGFGDSFTVGFFFLTNTVKQKKITFYFRYEPNRKKFSYEISMAKSLEKTFLISIKTLIEIFLHQIELFITAKEEFRLQYLLKPDEFLEISQETKEIVHFIKTA